MMGWFTGAKVRGARGVGGLGSAGLLLGAWAFGCGELDDEALAPQCSLEARKAYVDAVMHGVYLWAAETPEVEPADYASPLELIEALRYRRPLGGDEAELVDRWSTVQPAAVRSAFFGEGKIIAVGFVANFGADDRARVAWVYQNTPASRAGLRRGDQILSIAGVPVAELRQDPARLDAAQGPDAEGVTVEYEIRAVDGVTRKLPLTKAVVTLETVPIVKVLERPQGKVGYLMVTAFLEPTNAELKTAFARFKADGVSELVIDLRYNGGGLLQGARALGSYVAGAPHEGKVLFRTAHNPDYAHNDGSYTATLPEEALALPRAYFLVGPQTASASEAVINGLKPYLDITLVGEQTYGKPVGSTTRTHCDDAVTPITFRVVNSRAESDYFEGLPVDCAVPDDLERELGDVGEARFAAALALMDGADCPLATPRPSSRVPRAGRAVWVGPWASSVRE